MRLPSKITSYGESVISKFPPVLSVLQDADTGVLQRTSSKMSVPTIYTSLLFLAKKSLSFAETALMPILFGNAMILTRRLKKSG